ncbi:MAG: hypothetical protein AAGB27_05990, partial [Pseudomonadota bacterium]
MKKLAIAAGVLLLAVGVAAAANWRFVGRYVSYLWLGADPLTTPIEWFDPVVALDTGELIELPTTDRPTIPPQALEQAAAYAQAQRSLGLLVARGGVIEFERYWEGFQGDDWFNPQSMSKTVLGMAVGVAVSEGLIRSVDDPVGTYVS